VTTATAVPATPLTRKDDVAHSIASHERYSAKQPQPTVGLIDSDPKTNGHYPNESGRAFKPTWLIVAVVVATVIILAVVVHW
jgi:hypothetical protein